MTRHGYFLLQFLFTRVHPHRNPLASEIRTTPLFKKVRTPEGPDPPGGRWKGVVTSNLPGVTEGVETHQRTHKKPSSVG